MKFNNAGILPLYYREHDIGFMLNSTMVNRIIGHLYGMAEREKREQIPTEYPEEQTHHTLRRQDKVHGQRRDKTVSDFPQAAALAQVLKDRVSGRRGVSIKFVEQSNRLERNEILPLVQRLNECHYRNVSEVAEAIRLVQSR